MNKYTLGKNYVLRQNSPTSFELFNTVKSINYEISAELYLILKLFKFKVIEKEKAYNFFSQNGIKVDIPKFNNLLKQTEFVDLLVCSKQPYRIIDENNSSFTYSTPKRVELIITEKCNLKCKHCFHDSSPRKEASFPSVESLIRLCDEIEKLDVRNLKISGGEVLLYPELHKLIEHLSKKKFQKSILTNALLINDDLITLLKGNNFRFGISLDGATKEAHEFLRGKNTFEKTIYNIFKLKENKIYFSITSTIHKNNVHTIEDIVNFVFNKLEARVLNINVLMPIGRGLANHDLDISRTERQELFEKIGRLSLEYPNNVINLDDSCILSEEDSDESLVCAAGNTNLSINSFLEVYPCSYGFSREDFKMGVFGEDSLIDIWKSEKWNLFRKGILLKDLKECPDCEFKYKCVIKSCRLKPVCQGNDFYSHYKPCYAYDL